ncbi:MAG TPA: molybdopterin cofactor-binding domain-containing protein [Solirubrobacteraceae bacterium]|nr:molybdopterin cofactor-binding domain-containing protein [Solirubrobacteraceae bacterium]
MLGERPAGTFAQVASLDLKRLEVDGRERQASLADGSLLEVLREQLDVTAPKPACGEGACGACTVLLDGEPVRACVTPASEATGRSVTTAAGLARNGALGALQEAFLAEGAFQCGYCTPGMLAAASALLARNASPTQAQVRAALAGNVCRCCTYPRIERAVLRAARASARRSPAVSDAAVSDAVVGDAAAGDAAAHGESGGACPRTASFPEFRPARPWDRTAAEQREYFELLGDGLVVVLAPGARARGARPAGFRPPGGGAWLHVGADGTVTAFTGKIDMGEDNRTALSLLVAEELRVAPCAVRLAMGDTDLCPSDPGTFGSRSLPDAGEDLATAAACAREQLVELGAQRLSLSSEALEARAGEVYGDGRSVGYGELVRGLRRLASASAQAQRTARLRWRYAGHPALRASGRALVTGAHRFPTDIKRPGMLHGMILRAPSYGARLEAVNVARAAAMDGVTVVHEGEFVAVAGADRAGAERALAAIDADWSDSPQPGEEELAAYLRTHPVEVLGWQGAASHAEGDVETALAGAQVRTQATYTTPYIAHATLETRVALAEWQGERVTVWTGTQQPFFVRYELAAALGVAEERVRVIVPDFGGGFGSKHTEAEAIAAARLARAAGVPVRLALSREEEFRYTFMRPASVIDVHAGATRDGTITAWDFLNVNSGAPGLAPPYRIANQRLAFQPAESPLPQGPYRALAATANDFARESHIDELAHALALDPLQLRLRNLADERLAAVLRAAAEHARWSEERSRSRAGFGIGIAGGIEKEGRVATCALVCVRDGKLEIRRIVTAYDCGAIVNPATVENQVEGALVMGLGGALFEAVHFENGRIEGASMHSYRVPRITDVPPIELVLIDRPELPSAGAGETPIIAIAPALANAIFHACGTRIRSLPLLRDGRLAA